MRVLTSILKSGVIKYIIIILVGMTSIFIIQQIPNRSEVEIVSREALHGNANASASIIDFDNKQETKLEEKSLDFTKKVVKENEQEINFENYDLSKEELYKQQLFDAGLLNKIVMLCILLISIALIVYIKGGQKWKNTEM